MVKYKIIPYEKSHTDEILTFGMNDKLLENDASSEEGRYVGVPAPILNPVDEWFASPYGCSPAITKKQQDYMEQETKMKKAEVQTKEPDNIHQLMYEIATKNSATTLQIDPIGGSENVHR